MTARDHISVEIFKRQGPRAEGFTLDVAFEAPFEGVLGLVGPSGSGKSTLFACLAGLAPPDAGRIAVGGTTLFDSAARIDLPPARRGVGVVFQDGLLFPHLNVRRNLLYGTGRPDLALFDKVVETLGLGDKLKRRPRSLSGGERQRVAIGRALMAAPRLLLLDEPLSALDPARKEEILGLFETVRECWRTPMIYISHAPSEIRRLADRVLTLRDGRIAATCAELAPMSPGSHADAAFDLAEPARPAARSAARLSLHRSPDPCVG